MLLDDLQLEENDTIDEVESSDDSELEIVEALVRQLMFLRRHLSGCPLSKQSRNLSPHGSNLSKYVTDARGLCEW